MTPRDLAMLSEGFQWRERRAWEARAWIVAYLLQPWSGGKTIQPADLLKPASESEFEQVAGISDPSAAFDTFVQAQAEGRSV